VPQYQFSEQTFQAINPNYSINPISNLNFLGIQPWGTKYGAAFAQAAIGGLIAPLTIPEPIGWNKRNSDWESRAHLKFDAVMGPSLSGTIYFEIDAFRWGN